MRWYSPGFLGRAGLARRAYMVSRGHYLVPVLRTTGRNDLLVACPPIVAKVASVQPAGLLRLRVREAPAAEQLRPRGVFILCLAFAVGLPFLGGGWGEMKTEIEIDYNVLACSS